MYNNITAATRGRPTGTFAFAIAGVSKGGWSSLRQPREQALLRVLQWTHSRRRRWTTLHPARCSRAAAVTLKVVVRATSHLSQDQVACLIRLEPLEERAHEGGGSGLNHRPPPPFSLTKF